MEARDYVTADAKLREYQALAGQLPVDTGRRRTSIGVSKQLMAAWNQREADQEPLRRARGTHGLRLYIHWADSKWALTKCSPPSSASDLTDQACRR